MRGAARIGSTGALALLIALLAGTAAPGAGDAGAPADASKRKPKLQSCDLGPPRKFRCGHVRVPLFRDAPKRGSINVGFAVRPRSNQKRPSLGAIVAIEGGPGYSTTAYWTAQPLVAVMAPLLQRRELVLIDARGTGTSEVVKCLPLQRETMPEQAAVAKCARQLGPRRFAYTTAATVRDMEAVRKALRLGKIWLYGDSYGTLLGQAYAARFESKLRGLILDSAYPSDDPLWRTLYPAGRRAMRIACRRAPQCSGDGFAAFSKVVRRFRRTGRDLSGLLSFLVAAGNLAPRPYLNLHKASRMWLRGDRQRLENLIKPVKGHGNVRLFSYGLEITVECNDYPLMWNPRVGYRKRLRQLNKSIDKLPHNHFAPFTRSEYLTSEAAHLVACLRWPKPPKGGLEKPIPPGWKASKRLPTLVLAGELDNVTSVPEGRQVTRRFPNSRLFIEPNRGHASSLYFPFAVKSVEVIRDFIRKH